jgi:hypothetical protein
MPDQLTIVVQYQDFAQQWVAHFEGDPCHPFCANMPMVAVRQLLEGSETEPHTMLLRCDRDQSAIGVLQMSIVWDPPEILVPCRECEGRGEYVGLREREVCPS